MDKKLVNIQIFLVLGIIIYFVPAQKTIKIYEKDGTILTACVSEIDSMKFYTPSHEMAYIPAGTTPDGVYTINYDIEMSVHEVTFAEYRQYCEATNKTLPHSNPSAPSMIIGEDEGMGQGSRPMINIDLYNIHKYCNWLSEQAGLEPAYTFENFAWGELKGDPYDPEIAAPNLAGYRLPTDVEWMYAAIGGSNGEATTYAGSNNIDEVAWYNGNAGVTTFPIKEKKPNELGLYDMNGNVWEVTETRQPRGNENRTDIYGGCYQSSAIDCEIWQVAPPRDLIDQYRISPQIGFRIVRTILE